MSILHKIFHKTALSSKRKDALTAFRRDAVEALKFLQKTAKTKLDARLYELMENNVRNTPIMFYPRRILRKKTYRIGPYVSSSVTMGEHVNTIKVMQQGKQVFVIRSHFINLPSEHLFDEDKLTISGLFTLAHEYAHFPKPAIGKFAAENKLSVGQAEELLADMLAAKLAVTLGYSKEHVLHHFAGREIVYGGFPFRKWIQRVCK